jgi:histidyl-tRNA synthetase
VQEALREAPTIGDSLCEACVAHFAAVRAFLDGYGVAYELVRTLVRGLDYYTRTTWEFVGPEHGAQSTISAGGRYDGLIEDLGGQPTPGVGFGAGIERLVLALEDAGVTAEPPKLDVFLAAEKDAPRDLLLTWLRELRAAGVAADIDYAGRSLKGQLTQAGRSGAHTVVVVGSDRATVRRQGSADEVVGHADALAKLQS